jgi:hypothetical protein
MTSRHPHDHSRVTLTDSIHKVVRVGHPFADDEQYITIQTSLSGIIFIALQYSHRCTLQSRSSLAPQRFHSFRRQGRGITVDANAFASWIVIFPIKYCVWSVR